MFFRRMFSRKERDSTSSPASTTTEPALFFDNNNAPLSIVMKSPIRRRSSCADDKRGLSVIQLTPLWEHIIRTRTLPDDLNPGEMFDEFLERLRDPEWQVRQHALRVLIDVLIVMGPKADSYFAPLIPQLVENLGNAAPTVRKGALDAIRVYISESAMPESVLLEVMDIGLNQRITNEPFGGRLTCGVMLSLPSLVQATLHTSKRNYILQSTIDMLINKMTQVTHQEVTLKVLLRLRDLIGPREFSEYMTHGAYREFELLCNVYGLSEPETLVGTTSRSSWHAIQPFDQLADDDSSSTQAEPFWRTDEDEFLKDEDKIMAKVIMETEIKINDDTVTMRILESDRQPLMMQNGDVRDCCDNEEMTTALENSGLIQVLSDSELEDINNNSGDADYPPRTPKRVTFGGEIVKMRTPDSDTTVHSDVDGANAAKAAAAAGETKPYGNCLTVDIPNDNTKPVEQAKSTQPSPTTSTDISSAPITPVSRATSASSIATPSPASPRRTHIEEIRSKSASPFRRISISPVDALISPRPVHMGIEVMHNLQRSPCISPRSSRPSSRRNSAAELEEEAEKQKPVQTTIAQPSPVASWEELGIVDEVVLKSLKSGDWRQRFQAISAIEEALKSSENLAKIQPCLDSFLRMLLSSERNPEVAEDKRRILINLISRLPLENLENRSTQIITGLCRQGGAGANRVCKSLMHRLPPSFIVLKLLSDEFLHARSSRFRENALQMVMHALMTFPSTCFDMTTCISRTVYAALDRKRRVRQAALDVLAVLGQITSPRIVLDTVQSIAGNREDGHDLYNAVKARLARKQLPMVSPDGGIQYALRVPSPHGNDTVMDVANLGADVLWIISGVGSVSPTSIRRRSQRFMHSSKPLAVHHDRSGERRLKAPHEILAMGVGSQLTDEFISTSGSSTSGSFQGNSDDTDDSRTSLQYTLATGNALQNSSIKANNSASGIGGEIFGINGRRIASRSHPDAYGHLRSLNLDNSKGDQSLNKIQVTSRFPTMDVTAMYIGRQNYRNPYEQYQLTQNRNNQLGIFKASNKRTGKSGNHHDAFNESKAEDRPSYSCDSALNGNVEISRRFTNVEKFIAPSNKSAHQTAQTAQNGTAPPLSAGKENGTTLNRSQPATPVSRVFSNFTVVPNQAAAAVGSRTSLQCAYEEKDESSFKCIESSDWSSDDQEKSPASTKVAVSPACSVTLPNSVENVKLDESGSVKEHAFESRSESVLSSTKPVLPQEVTTTPEKAGIESNMTQHQLQMERASGGKTPVVDEVDQAITMLMDDQRSLKAQVASEAKLTPGRQSSLSKAEFTGHPVEDSNVEEVTPVTPHKAEPLPSTSETVVMAELIAEISTPNTENVSEHSAHHTRESKTPEVLQIDRMTPQTPSTNDIFESPLPIRSVSHTSLQEYQPSTNPPTPSAQSKNTPISNRRSTTPHSIRSAIGKSNDSIFASCPKLDGETKSAESTTSSDYPPSHGNSPDEPIRPKTLSPAVKSSPHVPLIRKAKTTLFGRNRRVSPVKQPVKFVQAEVFPQTLTRFERPKEAMNQSLQQVDSTEWETIIVGLRSLVRLMRHHPEVLDSQMHFVCMQMGKAVRNLRSQVSRAACQASRELFTIPAKFLEQECDDLVGNLLHRTADTNRFLRADATRGLESMCDNLTPQKVIHLLSTRGAAHSNSTVRTTAAKLLNRLVDRIGYERIFNMGREHRDKLLVMGANLLQEGSLETRSYTKTVFRSLAEHSNCSRIIKEVVPINTYRNIEKTLKSIM